MVRYLLAIPFMAIGSPAFADVLPPPREAPNSAEPKQFGTAIPEEAQKAIDKQGKQTVSDVVNTIIVCGIGLLVFGLTALGLVAWLIVRGKLPVDRAIQLIVAIVALTFGVFVTVAGYGQSQIAALMGLLGATLGYIFAKETKPDKPAN